MRNNFLYFDPITKHYCIATPNFNDFRFWAFFVKWIYRKFKAWKSLFAKLTVFAFWYLRVCLYMPSDRRHGTLAKNHGKLLASLAKILPWSYPDLAKDTRIIHDRAKRTVFYHDLGNDAKINHVLDKGSMVANPFFGNSYFLILFIFIALVSIAFSNFSNFNTFPQ